MPEEKLICALCGGGIDGPYTYIGSRPYHAGRLGREVKDEEAEPYVNRPFSELLQSFPQEERQCDIWYIDESLIAFQLKQILKGNGNR